MVSILAVLLAVIPGVLIILFVKKNDIGEEKPKKALKGYLLFGVFSLIAATILEYVFTDLFESGLVEGSWEYALIDGFIIAAVCEEGFKYLAFRLKERKNGGINNVYDGIVYVVYVGVSFAILENVIAAVGADIGTLILRMFTAIPAHACFAVFMGYFYAKAKLSDKGSERALNHILSLIVPIVLHGIYDSLISVDDLVEGDGAFWLAFLAWVVFAIVMIIYTFKFVKKVSKSVKENTLESSVSVEDLNV